MAQFRQFSFRSVYSWAILPLANAYLTWDGSAPTIFSD